jgi:hypothetical protein
MSQGPPLSHSFPERVCTACSRPIPPDAPIAFERADAYHVRCWARLASLKSFELKDQSRQAQNRSRTARARAAAAIRDAEVVRTCPACRMPLSEGDSLLFQGSCLVHTRCWRSDPRPEN